MDNYGIMGVELWIRGRITLTTQDYLFFIFIFCIFFVIFALYAAYSLSKMNYQLKLITKHLGADKKEVVPNDEIEKELERELKK